jgi:hypothetical protein
MALEGKRKAFVDHYFLCGLNGSKAAIKAGYGKDRARHTAYDLLQNEEVKAEVEKRLKAGQMGPEETLYRLQEHATVSFDDFFDLIDRQETLDRLYEERSGLEQQLRDLPNPPGKDEPKEPKELSVLRWALSSNLSDLKRMIREYEFGDSIFRLNLEKARDEGKLHLVKGVKWDKNGRPILEWANSYEAIKDTGRHHTLFTDNLDHTTGGQPFKLYQDVDTDKV